MNLRSSAGDRQSLPYAFLNSGPRSPYNSLFEWLLQRTHVFSELSLPPVPPLLAHYEIPGASLALVEGGRVTWSEA